MREELKVLELFGGIGAFTKALERRNIAHKVVDYVEIDKYAVKSFNAVHGTNFEPQDILTWDKDIEVDLIMHGSPCQDFSVAGKQAGGDKDSGTRSSLMYETLRIVGKLKPKYVIWENVKNLLSQKHRHNFDAYLVAMEKLGYNSYYQVLNAKHYGVPQNRERVFTISILGGGDYAFPESIPLNKRLRDILEEKVDDKYYLNNSQTLITDNLPGAYGRNFGSKGKVQDLDKEASTLQAAMGVGGGNVPLVAPTYKIRKLTPKECWRLMGFDDVDFKKAEKVNSNTQLYKQAGNSIAVNVLEAIVAKLLEKRDG